MTADQFLDVLKTLNERMQALAVAETGAAGTTGKLATVLKLQNEVRGISNRLLSIDMALRTETDPKKRAELELEQRQLKVKLQLASAQQRLNAASRIAGRIDSASLAGAFEGSANRAAAQAVVDDAKARVAELQKAADEGKDVVAEMQAAQAALLAAQADSVRASIETGISAFDNLAEDFKKLGPEGELMASMSSGIANMADSFVSAFDIIGNSGASASDKILAGMGAVNSIIQTIGSVQKAASDQRVRALDQEIAAEKKRDGKSQESLAKISALEAKKDKEKRKAFEADKKMKIAQTIMATATGAIEAYKAMVGIPIVGPALAAAAAGMVVAMGAKQLSIIQSSSYQGGGAAPSAGSQTISLGSRKGSVDLAKSQSARGELAYFRGESGTGGPENFKNAFSGYKNRAEGGNTAYMVGEQGPELFVPEMP